MSKLKKFILGVILLSIIINIGPSTVEAPYIPNKIKTPENNGAIEDMPVADKDTTTSNIVISLVGDILMDGSVANQIAAYGEDYPWEIVREYFIEDSLTIGNLETSITTGGLKWEDKQFNFRSHPKNLSAMKSAGVDMVSLANNHSVDYGYEGLLDTLRNLEQNDILYAGAGRNRDDAIKGAITEINSTKVGFLAYSRVVPDVRWYATTNRPGIVGAYDVHIPEVLRRIKELKEEVDILVLSIHWGVELSTEPREEETRLAKMAIDEGADIIMGHHPHVLQGVEIYKGKPIFYSLGNFVFGSKNDLTSDTMIAQISITDKEIATIRIVPLKIEGGRPIKKQEELSSGIDYINNLSKLLM